MNKKITEFSTFGSCSSRNIFNSNINKNYKDFFKINHSVEAVTLISLMSKPIEYDRNLVNSNHKYDNICVNEDLSKGFLEFLKKDFIDYIILDTLFDVSANIIAYDTNQYLTLTNRVRKTDFFNLIEDKRRINIFNDFDEYFKLWTQSCDDFFEFMNKNCKHTKFILNCSRSSYNYLDEKTNKILINKKFKGVADKFNPYRNLLDKYILENYDVEVLPFDEKTLISQNHIFGSAPTHFVSQYYSEKNKQLLEIINRNSKMSYDSPENMKFRESQRKQVIQPFSLPNFLETPNLDLNQKKNSIKSNILNSLNKYNTARIDIRNIGKSGQIINTVKLDNISDKNLYYDYPKWFENSEGKGIIIQSQSNFLKFDVECIGDGELNIILRGVDFKVKRERMPIYVKYTNFTINNKNIFNENKLLTHDNSYVYKMNVNDGQRITLYLEWLPL